jgi:TonB family protein
MTLWLADLVAYSVQLAVLVATAVALVTVLRVNRPRAISRLWQGLFGASLLWPAYQLWTQSNVSSEALVGGVFWSETSASGRQMRTSVAAIDADLAAIAVAVLAAGVAARLGWLGLGLVRLRSIRRASHPSDSLAAVSVPLQRELYVSADIRFSDAVASPATIGLLRPVVLLPRRMEDLPVAVQRAVLSHELIHVRRRDWLPALIEEVWCAILWFHPAARVLASRSSLARETLVDEATIAYTGDRRAYAAALLEFSAAPPPLLAASGLIGRRYLEQRIALIAQETSMPRSSLTVRMFIVIGAVVVAMMATTSSVPVGATLQAQPGKVYKPGQDQGVTLPRVVTEVKPEYTAAAMQARIQGTVWLTVVVLASGEVGDVTVAKSLDAEHGLDQQAVDATRQWRFEPGTMKGQPVPVEITIEMTFTLK